MGTFGIGVNANDIDSGNLYGEVYEIACNAWFTASGKPIPLAFKFKGEDEIIYKVSNLTIQSSDEKNYSGLPSKEFKCEAVFGGLLKEFKLIFFMDSCKWVMVI